MPIDENIWSDLQRPVPQWYSDTKFGIFIHWGLYSVPAWAEPSGELGTIESTEWFRHNPYAEWYWNTIRIDGSPAQQHHRETYGDAAYDDFLEQWQAESFDPQEWARLFARAGAGYVVPTTKHHDGVTLWDAPGTGSRNTVHRGPRRDLIADIATAVRAEGLRFGVYYSGGLDWSVSDLPPIQREEDVRGLRPNDPAYSAYAFLHMKDLIDRYQPDVLWNDIEWPDSAKRLGSYGLHELFDYYYAAVPEGVVNDRYGDTHHDYATSEYEHMLASESEPEWEQCRGLGFSFGFNSIEDESVTLSGAALTRLLVDIASRGGHLLLNVGPTAAGVIPEVQQRSLEGLGVWMAAGGRAVLDGSTKVESSVAQPSDEPWVRWLGGNGVLHAVIDADGTVPLHVDAARVEVSKAALGDGTPVAAITNGNVVRVDVPARTTAGPAIVTLPLA